MTSTALITGASRGIDAKSLARSHPRAGTCCPRARCQLGTARNAGGSRRHGKPESIEALAKRLRARNQRLDALVNNAGVYRGPAREIWDVNVLGPLLLTRALEPFLARNARV